MLEKMHDYSVECLNMCPKLNKSEILKTFQEKVADVAEPNEFTDEQIDRDARVKVLAEFAVVLNQLLSSMYELE